MQEEEELERVATLMRAHSATPVASATSRPPAVDGHRSAHAPARSYYTLCAAGTHQRLDGSFSSDGCFGGWTESMEADEYVEFLQDTASLVTRTTQAGEVVWCGSRFQMASLLPEDSAPSASLDHLKAPPAPAHPGAPPERLGSLR